VKHKEIYEKLYALQEEYNKHTNITRINSREDYYLKHIEDSLAIIPYLNNESSIIDIGSGGGYPGLPLAIELPATKITLNDSILKKTRYLEQVVRDLSLPNVTVIRERAEVLGKNPTFQGKYASATARAVSAIENLLPLISPLLTSGGRLYLMKSGNYQEEIDQAKQIQKKLNLSLEHIHTYKVGNLDRSLIVYRK
jgi:16S rRNA (guanine527-N7)-methyltransferase